jgi:hypothetical protein
MTCTELIHITRQIVYTLPSLRISLECVLARRHSIFVLAYIIELRSENLGIRIMDREQGYPVCSLDCLSPDSIVIPEFDECISSGIETIGTSLDIREERFARMSKCDLPEFDQTLFLSSISLFFDYKSEYNRIDSRRWIKT